MHPGGNCPLQMKWRKIKQGKHNMDVLLAGALHAEHTTVSAGHGVLALFQAALLLRASGLDAGKLDCAVGFAAHRGTRLLGVVMSHKAASCKL